MALEIILGAICVIGLYICWSIAQFNTAAKKERKKRYSSKAAAINYVDVNRNKPKRKKRKHKWT
tara:strand:+ start:456 stop:647 length:192 start_codon:yes stop_codon:yes gene_type:complete